MADGFNPQEMIDRFRERAEAVKKRNLPAVGGEERRLFIEQAERDFSSVAISGAARPPDSRCFGHLGFGQ